MKRKFEFKYYLFAYGSLTHFRLKSLSFLSAINVLAVFFSIAILSCNNSPKEKEQDPAVVNEQLTQMNRRIVEDESKAINDFISRHSFKTQMTGTGLRYQIYEHGNGEHPVMKQEVEIRYKVFLLDGTYCYSSDSTGSVKFVIGTNEQVRGLEEGVLLMVPGDKARFVVPAHLGFGMTGDGNKIPPASSLYFDVELLSVKK